MDQIFDRIETLLKSLLNQDRNPTAGPADSGGRVRPSGDSDLDDAMDELNAYLRDDKQEQERLERERARKATEEERRARSRYSSGGTVASDPSVRLSRYYKTLGLSFGAPMAEVKASYKRLLKQHHPDRHGGSPDAQKRATEFSARLNEAYDRIETWTATGKIPD